MKYFLTFSRILIGVVFVFSGLVKGFDPLGTAYRIEDYFIVFGMLWAVPFATFLSIFLCTLEFTVGISLLFNVLIKWMSWLLLAMMIYFTVLTFFDFRYEMVPDCGCFGDVIKLTNLQTFLKNIALMLFVIPVFIYRKRFRSWTRIKGQAGVLLAFAALFAGMSVHALYHLPVVDVLSWKKGNKVNLQDLKPIKFFVTYKNKETGEEKEYLMPNYPWNDSVWVKKWEFKSQRTEDPNKGGVTLRIEDYSGTDVTSSILDNPDLNFILVSYDLNKAGAGRFRKIINFSDEAIAGGYAFIAITSSSQEDVNAFRAKLLPDFDFYFADDVVLKIMVRSNPGLILLKNGVVLEKWSYKDVPEYGEIIKKYR